MIYLNLHVSVQHIYALEVTINVKKKSEYLFPLLHVNIGDAHTKTKIQDTVD